MDRADDIFEQYEQYDEKDLRRKAVGSVLEQYMDKQKLREMGLPERPERRVATAVTLGVRCVNTIEDLCAATRMNRSRMVEFVIMMFGPPLLAEFEKRRVARSDAVAEAERPARRKSSKRRSE